MSSRVLLGFFCALTVQAQVVIGYGAISGSIRDYTRAGIPDTTVLLTNDKTGFKRTLNTTDDGIFYGVAIPPETGYNLKITRKGFLDITYKDFEIAEGHTLDFRIVMKQDAAAQSPDAQTASIDMRDVTFGLETSFTADDVASLPSRDRDPYNLAPFAIGLTTQSDAGQMAGHSEASLRVHG